MGWITNLHAITIPSGIFAGLYMLANKDDRRIILINNHGVFYKEFSGLKAFLIVSGVIGFPFIGVPYGLFKINRITKFSEEEIIKFGYKRE